MVSNCGFCDGRIWRGNILKTHSDFNVALCIYPTNSWLVMSSFTFNFVVTLICAVFTVTSLKPRNVLHHLHLKAFSIPVLCSRALLQLQKWYSSLSDTCDTCVCVCVWNPLTDKRWRRGRHRVKILRSANLLLIIRRWIQIISITLIKYNIHQSYTGLLSCHRFWQTLQPPTMKFTAQLLRRKSPQR